MSDDPKKTHETLVSFLSGGSLAGDADAEASIRREMMLMADTLAMFRESLAHVATSADNQSRKDGDVEGVSDAWLLGYRAGKSRQGQHFVGLIGALQNSLDVWATSPAVPS